MRRLTVAIVAGWVIGHMKMEAHLEDWVRDMPHIRAGAGADRLTLADRIDAGFASVRTIVGKVWPYVMAGITVGAGIHGWVPQDFMASIMGREAWWSVPLAVAIGVPMYANAAGIIRAADHVIARAFCREGEVLVGWISTGTPRDSPRSRGADPIQAIVSRF
jgi:uncharacterized membrane protein YraQ (UPF0718 family)